MAKHRFEALNAGVIPTVAADGECVPGVDLAAVAALLNLPFDMPTALPAAILRDRLRHVLATAMRLFGQLPEAALSNKLANRDRTYLALANHIVEIAACYLDVAAGQAFDTDASAAVPAQELGRGSLFRRTNAVSAQLAALSDNAERVVETFFGPTALHSVLERCTWHAAQHTRQLADLLEGLRIEPDAPLTEAELDGLPMPAGIWD